MLIHQQIWDNIKGIGGYRAKDLEKIFVQLIFNSGFTVGMHHF